VQPEAFVVTLFGFLSILSEIKRKREIRRVRREREREND